MKSNKMTPMQRVLTTLSHNEPDRVPLFLLLTMHGAKELGISIKEYFSKSENVVEGQIRLQKKYNIDLYNPFFYASAEIEAFGGETIFIDDGPPNSGEPLIKDIEKIAYLKPPRIGESKVLQKALSTVNKLNHQAFGKIPVIGTVLSPFSLPVMQLGFDKYIEIMCLRKDLFDQLMLVNEAFCVNWANAQLEAGATAINYFDPVSSSTIVTREQYLETGFRIARRVVSKIKGPVVTHMASGDTLKIADLLPQTGVVAVGVSSKENLAQLKSAFKNKLTLLGNLNGIEMRRWTPDQTRSIVKEAIATAAPGGGFILSDNHGEIPFQVPDEVLRVISETVLESGNYPI